MSGSVYGTIFKISTWGESHGAGVGVVVDGCPAGLPLNEEDIQKYLDRRKPGQSLSIFIGPEGGFSDGEVELAMQSGVKPVTLGKRILRTETAGMFVMAAVGLLLES